MHEGCSRMQDFRYGIAKISQELRKFSKNCENFAIPTKFRYAHFLSKLLIRVMEYCKLSIF